MSELGKLTAQGVALVRALGALEREPRLRNPDHLAHRLLSPLLRLSLLPGVREAVRIGADAAIPGMLLFLLARTRAFDAFLLDEVRAGATQVVILGAGLDSRPYRFRKELEGARVFEVDLPATARWKRRQLEQERLDTAHVTFVGVDFAHERLDERLHQSGLRENVRTVWLWEGVTYYLPEPAVKETLRVIGRGPSGSAVMFDFFVADAFANPKSHRGAEGTLAMLQRSDEPIRFVIAPEGLQTLLSPFGLGAEVVLPPAALAERFVDKDAVQRIGGVFGLALGRAGAASQKA